MHSDDSVFLTAYLLLTHAHTDTHMFGSPYYIHARTLLVLRTERISERHGFSVEPALPVPPL